MSDFAAWGDDELDRFRDEADEKDNVSIDWQLRGKFKCPHCDRVLTTLGGVKSHVDAVHSEGAKAFRASIRAEAKERNRLAEEARIAETKRLEARKHRKVILSTAEIDEICAELNSLIGMMEPYWSQGDCAKDAIALIERLEAKAEGLS